MLRHFETITECGIFENFRWNSDTPDFERINLIYGSNGTGKTSLARALDGLRKDSGGFSKLSVSMCSPDGLNSRLSHFAHDDEFERIFVFSEGYVDRNHDFGGDTAIEAVLTLGERTVEDEKRITELRRLIDATNDQLTRARQTAHDASRALDNEFTSIARRVVTTLSRAGGEYRSNGTYSQARAKTRFSESHAQWKLLSDADREAALATVNSDERETVPIGLLSIVLRQGLKAELKQSLSSTPVSVVLDTLRGHEEASNWVERGRHLHEGLNQCIFCGGDLTSERMTQLEQHFSVEVEAMQRTLDSLLREIKNIGAEVNGLLPSNSISGLLFEDLRAIFNVELEITTRQAKDLTIWIARVIEALETKRANVIARVELDLDDPPSIDGSKIEETLKTHNDRVSQHSTLVKAAARKVELHILKEVEDNIATLEARLTTASKEQSDLETALATYRQDIAALENIEGDPLPSAEVMARELARILGRADLSFELLPGGRQYRITRNGGPARDLSTGERTAITLIHFLETVKRAVLTDGKLIVVIDDPVSSLDNAVSMGISTYIWSETVSKSHVEQVFLMTHNFELFRQWDIQISGLPGKRGPTNSNGYSSNCYELLSPHRNISGSMKRVPEFTFWPPSRDSRIKLRSAYHHSFYSSANTYLALQGDPTLERQLDAMLLYPNVLRRMLETFLAFKRPSSIGNFTQAMRTMGDTLEDAGYQGDADALRLHLTRFVHANSHADSPETDVVMNPEEIGATIAAVFTFMNAIDQTHYEGLCEVVGVDPTSLLLEVHSVDEL